MTDLDRLEALLAKAAPGELETVQNTNVCWEIRYPNWRRNHFVHDGDMAALVVEAINALPTLIAELRRLREGGRDADYVLVPRNMTPEMLNAWNAAPDGEDLDAAICVAYSAAIAASQERGG